ncbi:ribonuclease H-like protein, partial [Cubamyces menziesii]
DARAGSGIWIKEGDPRNRGERVPGEKQSNQTGEFHAVVMAHKAVPPYVALHIVSDSKYVVNGLTKWLSAWEEAGWIGVQNREVIRSAVAHLRSRSAPTTIKWVKGHSGVEGNEQADKLAAKGAEERKQYGPLALPPPSKYLKEGAELAELTQRIAYKGIMETKDTEGGRRKKTDSIVCRVLSAIRDYDGNENEPAALWVSLRNEAIEKRARDFIWRILHGAHHIGSFWSNIPGYEGRATCAKCGTTEDMDHILTKCMAVGQAHLWRLTRVMLLKRGIPLPEDMGMDLVAGISLCEVTDDNGECKNGDTRLLKIVVTETAYLIWKMRCERVIGREAEQDMQYTVREVDNRWRAALNARLRHDQAMTNVRLAGKKAVASEKVKATWEKLLSNEQDLPEDWAECGIWVLVGK